MDIFLNNAIYPYVYLYLSSKEMFSVDDNSMASPVKHGLRIQEGVQIRSYRDSDYEECREIFTEGMQQLINLVTHVVFPKYLRYLTMATTLAALASIKWSIWILIVSLFLSLVLLALLYVDIYIECWKFINYCLKTDLMDINKSYMTSDICHMWVAEWQGKIVGMVGLVVNEKQKPGVAELQRMSVSTTCRKMGVGRKLLEQLLWHAEQQRLTKIVLTTTSAQAPAIGLYKKYGFKLGEVFPYPQKILGDLEYWSFYLQL